MSALMSDVVEGAIDPKVSNAAVNAGGKLLKVVDMQLKYSQSGNNPKRELVLTGPQQET